MKANPSFLILIFGALQASPLWAETSIPALHSLSTQEDSIVFEVTSYGCSRDDDFELQTEGKTSITLIRKRADRCKRAPMAINVKRSLKENGLSLKQPFAVRNPFTPPPIKRKSFSKNYPTNYPTKGNIRSK